MLAVGATPSQLRRTQPHVQLDTPTPASTNISDLITSLKPKRSASSFTISKNNQNNNSFGRQLHLINNHLSNNNNNNSTNNNHQSHLGNILSTQDLNLDNLDHLEIQTDGTERQRRTLEDEIRRGMGELEFHDESSVSSAHHSNNGPDDDDSVGFGDLSDVESDNRPRADAGMGPSRATSGGRGGPRIEDDITGSQSGAESEVSLGDDFSLRIGMAGTRIAPGPSSGAAVPLPSQAAPHDRPRIVEDAEEDEFDLTYLTRRSSVSPPVNTAPPPHQQHHRSSSVSVVDQQNNNNNGSRLLARPSPFLNGNGNLPRSSFQQENHPASLAPNRSTAIPPRVGGAGIFGASGQGHTNDHPSTTTTTGAKRPTFVNFNSTSFTGVPGTATTSGQKPTAGVTFSPLSALNGGVRPPNNSRATGFATSPSVGGGDSPATRLRLPDVTGLTEGLPTTTVGVAPLGLGAGMGKKAGKTESASSGEGAALSSAMDQLRNRLSSLERENSVSASRVKELEERLREEQSRAASRPVVVERDREGVQLKDRLREEKDKREGLESLVERLRSQVLHLAHSLKSQADSLAELRSLQSQQQQQRRPSTDSLEREVSDLRHGLDSLGDEVDAVRAVVDQLVKEKEQHAVASEEWEKEEEERRRTMGTRAERDVEGLRRRAQAEHDDPDRTPRASRTNAGLNKWTGPDTPNSGKGFHSVCFPVPIHQSARSVDITQHANVFLEQREEIEALRQSILEEAARASSPMPQRGQAYNNESKFRSTDTRRPHFEPPRRPSTAPLPAKKQQNAAPTLPRHHSSYDSHIDSRPRRQYDEHEYDPSQVEAEEHYQDERERNDLDTRAERVFNTVKHVSGSPATVDLCAVCRKRRKAAFGGEPPASAPPRMQQQQPQRRRREEKDGEYEADYEDEEDERERVKTAQQKSRKELQVTIDRALRVLEDDFENHKMFDPFPPSSVHLGSKLTTLSKKDLH
ncbi:hypothetical protein T439DRAFT_333485 [Meredithblackwellia eburnea MCA 4105]